MFMYFTDSNALFVWDQSQNMNRRTMKSILNNLIYMNVFSPFYKNDRNTDHHFFNNSNRIARIFYRINSNKKIFQNAIKKGISVSNLLRAQFPYLFSDAIEPPIVSIELTNNCNLKCPYCTNSLGLRKKGFMSDDVFNKIINDLVVMKPVRIQLVGNGESTLHPNFGDYVSRLAKTNNYLSLVTNGQWTNSNIAEHILNAPLDLVEISIDAGGKEKYEASRINGKFDTLLSNILYLKTQKNALKSKVLINIRVMLRPTQLNIFNQERKFWSKYSDKVMPQFITKINNTDYEENVFSPIQNKHGDFPKCSMPFKHIEIKYTGEVLMCYYTQYQIGMPGLVIGDVMDSTINELWNSRIMKSYRDAHRNRDKEKMTVCKGCPGT